MSPFDSLLQLLSDVFGDVILYSSVKSGAEHRLGLSALLLMGLFLIVFARKAVREKLPEFRPLPGLSRLEDDLQQTIEKGQKVHFSVGVGSLAESSALQTLAGIDVLRHISRRAVAMGADFTSTTASAVTLPAVEAATKTGYEEIDSPEAYDSQSTRFVAPQPVPYAAGVMRILKNEDVGYNAMIGSFGDEYLLMGETGAQKGMTQLVATANPSVLPFAMLTASYPLIGEELFAASAYVEPKASRIGSILAQDLFRTIAIVTIVGGSVIASVLGVVFR